MPIRVKYSPLPWRVPEVNGVLRFFWVANEITELGDLTRIESWSNW